MYAEDMFTVKMRQCVLIHADNSYRAEIQLVGQKQCRVHILADVLTVKIRGSNVLKATSASR